MSVPFKHKGRRKNHGQARVDSEHSWAAHSLMSGATEVLSAHYFCIYDVDMPQPGSVNGLTSYLFHTFRALEEG